MSKVRKNIRCIARTRIVMRKWLKSYGNALQSDNIK